MRWETDDKSPLPLITNWATRSRILQRPAASCGAARRAGVRVRARRPIASIESTSMAPTSCRGGDSLVHAPLPHTPGHAAAGAHRREGDRSPLSQPFLPHAADDDVDAPILSDPIEPSRPAARRRAGGWSCPEKCRQCSRLTVTGTLCFFPRAVLRSAGAAGRSQGRRAAAGPCLACPRNKRSLRSFLKTATTGVDVLARQPAQLVLIPSPPPTAPPGSGRAAPALVVAGGVRPAATPPRSATTEPRGGLACSVSFSEIAPLSLRRCTRQEAVMDSPHRPNSFVGGSGGLWRLGCGGGGCGGMLQGFVVINRTLPHRLVYKSKETFCANPRDEIIENV